MGSTSPRKLLTQLQISRTATTGPALRVGAATSDQRSSGVPKHPPGAQGGTQPELSACCRITSHLALSTQALEKLIKPTQQHFRGFQVRQGSGCFNSREVWCEPSVKSHWWRFWFVPLPVFVVLAQP